MSKYLDSKSGSLEESIIGLVEKSVSVSQQQAAGAALAAKRGELDKGKLQGASLEMYKSMSEKDLEDFAKTKHKGLPDKKEAVSPAQQAAIAISKKEKGEEPKNEEVELDEAMRVLAKKGKTQVVTTGDGVAKVMVGGKEVAAGDLDDGAGGWFMSAKGQKGQKFFDSPQKIADFYGEEFAIVEKIEYVEYKFKNRSDAEKAKAYFDGIQLMSFDVEDDDIANGELRVDSGSKDMTKYHKEVLSKFRPKVITSEEKELDPVNKKALKKDFDDRKDQDLDNDGDTDKTDKYLHKRRQAITKSVSKEEYSMVDAVAKHINMWEKATPKKEEDEMDDGSDEVKGSKTMTGKPKSKVEVDPKDIEEKK